MKAHILIVEDEAILYERLRRVLEKENYSVADYSPSVKDAVSKINAKRPDLVLLDIDLQGNETGLELGKLLNKDYKIPFIYVTQFDDNETFFNGLGTNHEDFMVKTKPRLDSNELLRKIQTVLNRNRSNQNPIVKEAVMGLVGYLDELKEYSTKEISRVPVNYEDIVFFSSKSFVNSAGTEESLKANYIWFQSKDKKCLFLKSSLKEMLSHLPYHFVRINESQIVNIAPGMLNGRINGSRLSIMDREFTIKTTYKEEVKNRLDFYYQGK